MKWKTFSQSWNLYTPYYFSITNLFYVGSIYKQEDQNIYDYLSVHCIIIICMFYREKKENKSQVEEIATLLATHKSEDVYLKFLDYLETDYDWLALQLKVSFYLILSVWKV